MFYLHGVSIFILHVLISPLGGDRVLVEKAWDPGFVSSLPGFSPLSFLQHKLFLSGTHLVSIHDGSGNMLPKSATFKSDANRVNALCITFVVVYYFTDVDRWHLGSTFQTQTLPVGLSAQFVSWVGRCECLDLGSTMSPVGLSVSHEWTPRCPEYNKGKKMFSSISQFSLKGPLNMSHQC